MRRRLDALNAIWRPALRASIRATGRGDCSTWRTSPRVSWELPVNHTSRGVSVADRRAGKVPHVKMPGGGTAPRDRNKDGTWRKKRSDAGKPKPAPKKK